MNRRLLLLTSCAGLLASPAAGHPVYTDHIEHRAGLRLDRRNIDLTLELTFFELRSLAERRLMDRNRDGLIRPDEQAAYLAGLRDRVQAQVRLLVDGRELDLVELFDPELELPGPATLGQGHHRLRLALFARRPAWMREGSVVELENRLWAGGPCLWSLSAEARDDLTLGLTRAEPPAATSPSGEPPALRGRCTISSCAAIPAEGPRAIEPPRSNSRLVLGPLALLLTPALGYGAYRRRKAARHLQ